MRKLLFALILMGTVVLPFSAMGQGKEVIVYEALPIHIESAGGWVAVEKGFYGKVKVKEIQGEQGLSPIQKVVESVKAGQIAFGIESPENIIRAQEKEGLPVIGLGVDFQNNPIRIISWKPIRSSKDLKGTFGVWPGYETRVKCLVGKGWEKQVTLKSQGEDLQPWLSQAWTIASARTYRELIVAQREVKKLGKTFYTVDYKDLGIDWMDHVLFSTEEILKKYPEIVQTVVTGRYKGFQWALLYPSEAFEILKKISENFDLAYEMDALDPVKVLMITADTKRHGLGYIQPKKWENIARDMFKAGLLERMPEVKRFYSEKFPSGIIPR